ncbi:MAG TPA: ribosome maturation factor RimP [Acidimicrobiia bacterium]|nr:ribosome maturation factor RimP [Acidimicrobiia bacterium]
MPDVATIAPAIDTVVVAHGLELYDVELAGPPRSRSLRILVDRDGGIDLETISAVSDALSRALDADPTVAQVCPGRYTLEVSSPGLERRLRTPAHFRRALDSTVSIKTSTGDAPLRRRGHLVAADDDGIDVEFDTGRERLAYRDIVQARTVFEWGPSPKPGTRRNREVASR